MTGSISLTRSEMFSSSFFNGITTEYFIGMTLVKLDRGNHNKRELNLLVTLFSRCYWITWRSPRSSPATWPERPA
jgi:hypothetical protein